MTNHQYNWPPTFTRADRRRFTSLINKAARREGLTLHGEMPFFTLSSGAEVFLLNLAIECASMPQGEWAAHIASWFKMFAITPEQIEELGTMSRDVAEASLRIRLLPEDAHGEYLNKPSMPGLMAALFIRRVGYSHNVKEEMLEHWGFGVDEAFDVALRNTLERETYDLYERDDVLLVDGPSNFASSRVLSLASEPLRDATHFDDGDRARFIVSVPTRNCFLSAVLHHDGSPLRELLATTISLYERGPGSTLPCAWFVDLDTFGTWGEGAERIDATVIDLDDGPHLVAMTGPMFDEHVPVPSDDERPAA